MRYVSEWRAVAKRMRALGYTMSAISRTMENLGRSVSTRTLYHLCRGVSLPENTYDEPLSLFDVALLVTDEEEFCKNRGLLRYRSEEMFSEETSSSPCVLDLSTFPDPHGVVTEMFGEEDSPPFIWYPQSGNGSGLKTYLDYERRQNRQAERIDKDGWNEDLSPLRR